MIFLIQFKSSSHDLFVSLQNGDNLLKSSDRLEYFVLKKSSELVLDRGQKGSHVERIEPLVLSQIIAELELSNVKQFAVVQDFENTGFDF